MSVNGLCACLQCAFQAKVWCDEQKYGMPTIVRLWKKKEGKKSSLQVWRLCRRRLGDNEREKRFQLSSEITELIRALQLGPLAHRRWRLRAKFRRAHASRGCLLSSLRCRRRHVSKLFTASTRITRSPLCNSTRLPCDMGSARTSSSCGSPLICASSQRGAGRRRWPRENILPWW